SELANRPPELTNHGFEVDAAGQLLFPPTFVTAPVPRPLDFGQLNPEQTELWLKAQRAELEGKDVDLAIQAYRDFLKTNPGENFAALAYYALGLLLEKQQRWPTAYQMYAEILAKYPKAFGESGLPLYELAQMKSFELAPRHFGFRPEQHPELMDTLC